MFRQLVLSLLSVMLLPVHRWIEARTEHADLAAIISVVVTAIAVLVPALYMAQKLVAEAVKRAVYCKRQLRGAEWLDAVAAHSRLAISQNGSLSRVLPCCEVRSTSGSICC
ncbi:hypothetical protein [Sinorhizobium meliloti]|uniref:hypothetical protein n=1 Tax=Rhizobium meliloti TaxID=382 RepID=UPI003F15DD3E